MRTLSLAVLEYDLVCVFCEEYSNGARLINCWRVLVSYHAGKLVEFPEGS